MAIRASSAGMRARLGRFARAEDGSFIMFGLFLFIGILLIGGVGVDIMRHDYERLRMQSTLDSAILAAADLDQHRDPETVVRDFFDKAGMGDRVRRVDVVNEINSRVVSADASTDLQTMFLRLLNIDTIANATHGTAREDIRDIEVSLVLDVSISMRGDRRLANLKTAAKSFVSSVLLDEDGRAREDVTVNLVPYAQQVTVGRALLSEFNLRDKHNYSYCIEMIEDDFNSLSLNPGRLRRQAVHFDVWSNSNSLAQRGAPADEMQCYTDQSSEIRYMSQDIDALHRHIDSLVANGSTSTDLGLRWGTALLDPSMRPVLDSLRDDGLLSNASRGRPYDHDRPNTMKIVVLMTDGQNHIEFQMREEFSGDRPSGVFMHTAQSGKSDPQFSVRETENGFRDGDLFPNEAYFIPGKSGIDEFSNLRVGGDAARELTFAELWATGSVTWHAKYLRSSKVANYRGSNFWRKGIYREIGPSIKDPRQSKLCEMAKDAGMIIFAVALDIAEKDATRMRDCASTGNHYFNVRGTEINYAFDAIAGTINQLKLVQ